MGSIPEFFHLWFLTQSWIQPFCTKKLHSFLFTQLYDSSHLEFCQCCILTLPFCIETTCFLLSNSLTLAKINSHHLHKKTSLIESDSNWMMAAILYSAMLDADTGILDSDTLLSSLRFTQKYSPSNLTLTQSHSFSLNLMMATILNSVILNSADLAFSPLSFPSQSHSHFSRLIPNI